ncbi:MAG: phospholipase D-like domain-containing protein [Candidatus Acidiferrales bacterium]
MKPSIPEEAVVDASFSDPLGAASLLVHLAATDALRLPNGLLADIARDQNINPRRFDDLLTALLKSGLLSRSADEIVLETTSAEALKHAAVLRGVAYAQYRRRDSNQVDMTLSPPAHPSRLMERLPKHGFSWTRLFDTKDSLVELSSQAERRLAIISPFLDSEGLQWIAQLFETTARKHLERLLIIRGRDQAETALLAAQRSHFVSLGVKVFGYSIAHEPGLRKPTVETFHAKIVLADDDKAYIGSANMTRWSRDFSLECGVILRGPSVRPVATLVDAIIGVSEQLA